MNSFTLLPATSNTLPDLYALHADATEAGRLMETYCGRVERGEADLSHTLILRTERGVEGTVMFGPAPHPYVFPRLRSDAFAGAIATFLLDLRQRLAATPERRIVLDSARADVPAGPVMDAGWMLDETYVNYETDLTVGARILDSAVRRLDAGQPDVQSALAELGRADLSLREGWTLHGLYHGHELRALGAFGSSGRPDGIKEANIDLIGVRPAFRRAGVGSRIHAHLLSFATKDYDRHIGSTSADNYAMRRVFEHSGSVHLGTQRYFRQP